MNIDIIDVTAVQLGCPGHRPVVMLQAVDVHGDIHSLTLDRTIARELGQMLDEITEHEAWGARLVADYLTTSGGEA